MFSAIYQTAKPPVNLRRRVFGVTVGLVAGSVILAGSAVFLFAERSLRRNLDSSLVQLARTEIASATDTGTLHIHETGPQTLNVSGVPGYEKFVWLENGAGKLLAATANVRGSRSIVGTEDGKAQALRGVTSFGDLTIDGRPMRAVYYGFRNTDSTPAVGIVCFPSTLLDGMITQIGEVVLGVGAFCILIGVLAAHFLAKFVADPLVQLARQVADLDPSSPVTPQAVAPPYDEIASLTDALNGLGTRVSTLVDERETTIRNQRRFVADTSHELRTPVANLQGTLEVALRRERTADDYRMTLQTSLNETQRLARLVEDLLILAKSDESTLEIRTAPSDLVPTLEEALSACRKDPIETKVDLPKELVATVDRVRIRQAVDNLLRNAFSHAKTCVILSAERLDSMLSISVSNDGPSLTPEQTVSIFERFQRLDHSRARDTGGMGLGLAIVKAIASGHGGSIRVTSNEALTTFTLLIPTG